MSHPFICTRCRHALFLRAIGHARINQNGRRGFISLRQQDKPDDAVPPEASRPSPSRGSLLGDYAKKKPLPKFNPLPKVDHTLTDLFIAKERIGPSVTSRYSKLLFPTQEKPSEVPRLERSQLEKDLASISEALIDADGDIRDPLAAWTRFEQSPSFRLGLDPSERSLVDSQLLQDSPVLTNLLMRIVRLRTRKLKFRESVSLSKVISWYSELGLMEGRWMSVMYRYIINIIYNAGNTRLNSGSDPVYVSRIVVFQDLCELWRWSLEALWKSNRHEQMANPISQTVLAERESAIKQQREDGSEPQLEALRLPKVSEMFLFTSFVSADVKRMLSEFCSSHRGYAEGKVLGLAATLTCHLIHSFEGGKDIWKQSISDMKLHDIFLAYAIYGRWLDKASINEAYQRTNLNTQSVIALRAEVTALRQESADPVAKTQVGLEKAVSERNIKRAINVWIQYGEMVRNDEIPNEVQMKLYGAFLTTFIELRRKDQAIEVWNSMIQSGKQPKKEHWIIMVEGAMRQGDIDSLEGIWQQVRAAGIRPDNDMWKIYLQGLFKFRQWERGLGVLEELGTAWELEVSGPQLDARERTTTETPSTTPLQNGYLPDIKPINTVIRGLLRLHKQTQIQRVLDWAASHNLKPDVETYHFLLLDAVRADDVDQVNRLIRSMETAKVAPNVKIFTVLMDFAFRNQHSDFQRQSPEQQQQTVAQVLADMEEAGIEADTFTYSTLLSGLLQPPCLNLVAARAVIEQMAEKKIPISPHMHTILIGHYFSQDPPDLAAVDSLWAKIQIEQHPVDHVFFDRMIEEYARIGELEKMLIFLRKMVVSGKLPGWDGLSRILNALARAQEWGWVQDLLNDVVDERGLFRYGARSARGKDEFWDLVDRMRVAGVELPTRP